MAITLTPDVLRAAYDYLSACRPFSEWNLPDSDDIVFKVAKCPRHYGWYDIAHGRHMIFISRRCVTSGNCLLSTMAHEMLHLHQNLSGMESNDDHNQAFIKLAAQICRVHGFDLKSF